MVDRCICKRTTFKQLIEIARSVASPDGNVNMTLHALADQTGCGNGCGMCVPYMLVALRTKQPRVPIMSEREFEKHLGAPVPRCLADVPGPAFDPSVLLQAR
jgi:bacterioferritin-associated ferredoxin